MKKPASLGMKRAPKSAAAAVPAGDKDIFTISVLDQQGNVMATDPSWTLASTTGDATVLTLDPPTGLSVGEHFLKAGTVSNHHVVTFPDGTSLSLDDTVTITGVPGSLVGVHSTPAVGP